MVKFRQKSFTIPEGHYTGPKDIDKVPGFIEMVGKSALVGAGIGGVAGGFIKDSSILDGAITGGKYGTLSGFILKFFLNYFHNPMSSVKYQEIDKKIRREFGIYRIQGITIGDSVDKRSTIDEKFGFNDRNVLNYKINFSVQDNKITMYTLGLTDQELDKTSKILDYYCKKYYGMEYSSTRINEKTNSYSVSIIFTNYQVISNFIMELSNELKTKINLLDNKAILDLRLNPTKTENEEEKQFSVKEINKYDLIKILGESGAIGLAISSLTGNKTDGLSSMVMNLILSSVNKYSKNELPVLEKLMGNEGKDNKYLENILNKLHYLEGFNYTVGNNSSDLNISMISGLLLITVNKNSDKLSQLDNIWDKMKTKIRRTDTGKVVVYTYFVDNKSYFEYILNCLMSSGLTPNIFQK